MKRLREPIEDGGERADGWSRLEAAIRRTNSAASSGFWDCAPFEIERAEEEPAFTKLVYLEGSL